MYVKLFVLPVKGVLFDKLSLASWIHLKELPLCCQLQVSLNITKRVMLQGVAATAKQVMLDHRANHPAIVISR